MKKITYEALNLVTAFDSLINAIENQAISVNDKDALKDLASNVRILRKGTETILNQIKSIK